MPTQIELKDDFEIIEEGTAYKLPTYNVTKDGLVKTDWKLQIDFVRGSKDNDEDAPYHTGTLHEHLLSMMIADLQYKNSLVPSREGSLAITKLQEAYHWILQRQIDRKNRNVEGTYKE